MKTNKQALYEAITGYDANGETGARDDFYCEELRTKQDRISYLVAYASNGLDMHITEQEANEVNDAIEKSANGNDRYYAWLDLGNDEDRPQGF